jgi:hypothetical protein
VCFEFSGSLTAQADGQRLEMIRQELDSYDGRIVGIRGSWRVVSEMQDWFERMVTEGNTVGRPESETVVVEDRAKGYIDFDSATTMQGGKRSRFRHIFDGKATASFVYPDGTQLHRVVKRAGLAPELTFEESPSSFAGLRIRDLNLSLARLCREAEVTYLGLERLEDRSLDRISLRPRDGVSWFALEALLDPNAMFIPRRLEYSVGSAEQPVPLWKAFTRQIRELPDPITGQAVPFPQQVTVHHYFDGRLAQVFEYESVEDMINSPFQAGSFSTDLNALPEGILVEDAVSLPGGAAYVTAGREDLYRARLEQLFPGSKAVRRPVIARLGRWDWVYSFIGVVFALGLIAVGLYLRRSHV